MSGSPNCYACKWRCSLPGDAHSKCLHPEASTIGLISILAYGRADFKTGLKVSGDAHGVREGWFMWPENFDPIWLRECNGFAPKAEAAA